jgi:hypothetical protein
MGMTSFETGEIEASIHHLYSKSASCLKQREEEEEEKEKEEKPAYNLPFFSTTCFSSRIGYTTYHQALSLLPIILFSHHHHHMHHFP